MDHTAVQLIIISLQNASPDVCKVLVGNKLDCEDERIIEIDRGKAVSVVWPVLCPGKFCVTLKVRGHMNSFVHI